MTTARWVMVVCTVAALLAIAWMLVPYTAGRESCSGALQNFNDTSTSITGLGSAFHVDTECSIEAHARLGIGLLGLVLVAGVGGAALYVDRRRSKA